ncbi:MAG: hypothetical protein GQ475_04875 [Methylococcaceae bacterium]|nr:hypothetical protein [Methylococcaceae bacterium]
MKKYLLYTAMTYLVFVVYGSLVPLDFNHIPFEVAWERFENIQYLNLGIGSRADWVANILLFIPLAFLWTGLLSSRSHLVGKILVSFFISLCCALLSVSIEFTQLFFPPRTVSLNDIIAECSGTVIGISAWWLFRTKLTSWFDTWILEKSTTQNLDRYLQIYLVFLFLYNVMPLDLTISPIEIYHKWNEGRIILLPFTHLKEVFAENIYEWLSEIALWLPVPLLWQRTSNLSVYQLWMRVFLVAFIIEFFQLFVYSRVTDVTDVLLALVGSGIGIWGGRKLWLGKSNVQQNIFFSLQKKPLISGCIFYTGWCFVLMLVFWYPYNFELNNGLIKLELNSLFNIPFYSYYYGTEFRAITEVFHKTMFFMPLGWILAFFSQSFGYRRFFWLSICILLSSSLMIEIVQLFLPEKTASSTDILLEVIGGQIGFIMGRHLFYADITQSLSPNKFKKHLSKKNSDQYLYVTGEKSFTNDKKVATKYKGDSNITKRSVPYHSWMILILGIIIATVIMLIVGKSPAVPYNIRELIGGENAFFRSLGLSLSLFWCFGFPVWFLSNKIEKKLNPLLCFIYGVAIHSFAVWFFIRMFAPLESIHDIVGSPILTIPAELEIFGRFFFLFSIFSLSLFASILYVFTKLKLYKNLLTYFVMGFIVATTFLPVCYWVVVIEAATDNITELMMDNGLSFSIIGFFLYMLLFGYIGSILSAFFAFRQKRILLSSIALLIISFPLGYILIDWATESLIFKYGDVFSAMQFLLSPDRKHFVTEGELFFRFSVVNFALIGLVCCSQFAFWVRISVEGKNHH